MVVYARCNGPFAQILARARLGGTRMGNGSVCASIMASVWQAGQRARQSARVRPMKLAPRTAGRAGWKKRERERESGRESARWVIPHRDNGNFDSGIKRAPPLFFLLRLARRFEARIHHPRASLELSVKKKKKKRIEVGKRASKRELLYFNSIRMYPVSRRRYADFRLCNFTSIAILIPFKL